MRALLPRASRSKFVSDRLLYRAGALNVYEDADRVVVGGVLELLSSIFWILSYGRKPYSIHRFTYNSYS